MEMIRSQWNYQTSKNRCGCQHPLKKQFVTNKRIVVFQSTSVSWLDVNPDVWAYGCARLEEVVSRERCSITKFAASSRTRGA